MPVSDLLGYLLLVCVVGLAWYIYFSYEDIQLVCIVSKEDGNHYCVRERERVEEAADLLARVTQKCKHLVEYVSNKYPDKDNVQRLQRGFQPHKISEILPTSSYTAYSENKGEKMAFCLNKYSKSEADNQHLIDEHTLTFVAIHELSHIATQSIGHKTEFWDNFKFLLIEAKAAGIHEPEDYKKDPVNYCSLEITDNPYFDA